MFHTQTMDRVGQILAGRFRLTRLLGSGGMGSVYLAEHVHLGRPTAVKVLRREIGLDPDAEARFRREALLAAKINHPSVAQVYDFDRTPDGEFFLAMEFIDGETTATRLRRDGAFPLSLVVRVLRGVAGGLDRAHSLKILHRDLKPENIMLTREGQVKLLDFGVARPLESTSGVTSSGFAVGTPAYMSPEQLTGDSLGPPSDIYSLGTVVYELLTGQQPHAGATFAELRARRLSQPPAPVHRLRDACPSVVTEVVARALEVEPKARWPSATSFADALADAIGPDSVRVSVTVPAVGPVAVQLGHWEAHFEALRFAGRDREMRAVRDAWAAARAGRTTVVWIEGDEGAGKSGFFELAQREAATDGALELSGRGYEGDVARPYGPWLPMLRAALDTWAGRDRPWPAITALTDARQDTRTPERGVLYDEVAALLHVATGRGPMLLGMEDVNWCDPASIALLEYLAHHTAGKPVLFAVTAMAGAGDGRGRAREMRERLRRLDNVVWVPLRPLGYEAVAAWLTRALGREAPEELVRYVYGNTEGNAFFIEQVVRSLVERGEMERMSADSARLALSAEPPPEAVADVVERRLRGMSAAAREVLQVAAVVGREFDLDLLGSLTRHTENEVLDAMDEAEGAGVLAPVTDRTGDWYRFTHNKIAHVLSQTINPRRRRRLHREIAEALAHRPDRPAGSVAWHWYYAGDAPQASEAGRAAARHALAVHDYDDALTFAVMAAETGQTVEEKVEAHELRGDALRRLDRHGEAAAAYARARLLGGVLSATVVVLRYKELRSALLAGTVSPAVAVAEATRLGTDADAASALDPGTLDLLLAEAHVAAGEPGPAIAAAEQALRAAQAARHQTTAADALVVLGHALLREGDVSAAGQRAGDARAVYLELADPYGLARVAELESAVAVRRGDLARARQALDDAAIHAERAGLTRMVRQFVRLRTDLADRSELHPPR
jgi:hypothetical protein